MTAITDAIAATSPSIWYRLDETSGTTAINYGSQVNPGTYSGSYDHSQPGPEVNTVATRLYTGGQIISQPMDLTTLVGMSIGFWASTDASGTVNVTYPFVGIGDPANRLARGPLVYEQHAAVGQPTWFARWWSGTTTSSPTVQPFKFWHWVVATYASGSGNVHVYVDGVLGSVQGTAGTNNPLATDCLLIRMDQPVVVSHVCWWGGVLTQTQINSIASALAPWPYAPPINLPPPEAPSGGGLTPEQATQLSDIHGWTNDIPGMVDALNFISSTVNHISGVADATKTDTTNLLARIPSNLGNILQTLDDGWRQVLSAVTGTAEEAGAAIQRTVGELLSNRPAGALEPVSLTGGVTCVRVDLDLSGSRIYGIILRITAYPADWQFRTPDAAWSLKDLAVIRWYAGADLALRHGVHTLSHSIVPTPQSPLPWIGPIPPLQPDGARITVDWAEGVCGELFALQAAIP